jgi:hypothetical protein
MVLLPYLMSCDFEAFLPFSRVDIHGVFFGDLRKSHVLMAVAHAPR